MPSTDLDLPLLPSAEQIRRREFATIRRGYDPDQVRDYLAQIAEQIEVLEAELREAKRGPAAAGAAPMAEPAPPQDKIDPYEELSKRMAGVMATIDREAQSVLDEAKAESGRMMSEARTEADRIRVDAQSRAEEARQEGGEYLELARMQAEQVLSGLSARREELVGQLQQMQSRLLGVAHDLEAAIEEPDPASQPPRAESTSSGAAGREDLWVSTAFTDLPPLDFDLDVEPETPRSEPEPDAFD